MYFLSYDVSCQVSALFSLAIPATNAHTLGFGGGGGRYALEL